jgi:hypothetical protein
MPHTEKEDLEKGKHVANMSVVTEGLGRGGWRKIPRFQFQAIKAIVKFLQNYSIKIFISVFKTKILQKTLSAECRTFNGLHNLF